MRFKNKYRTQSTRLPNWDYSSAGMYFISICTKNRIEYFGEISSDSLKLSEAGKIADKIWQDIAGNFSNVELDEYVVMPNHIHGIIRIIDAGRPPIRRDAINRVSTDVDAAAMVTSISSGSGGITGHHSPMINNNSISAIIRWYKAKVTSDVRKLSANDFFAWQPRFYDRIIRSEEELYNVRNYIINNPLRWNEDEDNIYG